MADLHYIQYSARKIPKTFKWSSSGPRKEVIFLAEPRLFCAVLGPDAAVVVLPTDMLPLTGLVNVVRLPNLRMALRYFYND